MKKLKNTSSAQLCMNLYTQASNSSQLDVKQKPTKIPLPHQQTIPRNVLAKLLNPGKGTLDDGMYSRPNGTNGMRVKRFASLDSLHRRCIAVWELFS